MCSGPPPRGAYGFTIHTCGLCNPPVIVHNVWHQSHAFVGNSQRAHQIARACTGSEHLTGEPEQQRPEKTLYGKLPFLGVPGGELSGVCAEQKSGAGQLAGEKCDPKGSASVSRDAEHSVEISFPNEFPNAGIIQSPKSFRIRPSVGDLDPVVSIQQGNIPFDLYAKFRINARSGAAQPAPDARDSAVTARAPAQVAVAL